MCFVTSVAIQTGFAQNITGNITDENGVPLPDANVVIEGTTQGVSTDFDGNVTQGTIPRRLIYPNGESSTNPESFAAALARQGQNEFTTRVWWDQ